MVTQNIHLEKKKKGNFVCHQFFEDAAAPERKGEDEKKKGRAGAFGECFWKFPAGGTKRQEKLRRRC